MTAPLTLSIIVPTLDEANEMPSLLANLAHVAAGCEVIVADGGSRDATCRLAEGDARVVHSSRGRARQMNAGARVAAGDVLLFLHADCRLPESATAAVKQALRQGNSFGAFHKRFDSTHLLLRQVRWRTSLWWRLGCAFGDQAVFVSREEFQALGGFREDVACEDMDLTVRARRRGRGALLPLEVRVSARRLQDKGILSTWARWWWIGAIERARLVLDVMVKRRQPSVRNSDEPSARANGDHPR